MKRIVAALSGTVLLILALWLAALIVLGTYQQYWQAPQQFARLGVIGSPKLDPRDIAMRIVYALVLIRIMFVAAKLLRYSVRENSSSQL